MSIESIRLNSKARNQLITLKRKTKIENWNILCRWAFCLSLQKPEMPSENVLGGEAAIEMTWRTFGGEYADIYLGLLKYRCLQDQLPIDQDTLSTQLRRHLHRGIGHLVGKKDLNSIEDLITVTAGKHEEK